MTDNLNLWEKRTLPSGLALEMLAGDDPALVLAQGENRVRVELANVKTLVAALTDAAADLAWKGILSILGKLSLPASETAFPDTQLFFELRGAPAACLKQIDCFHLEFSSVLPSCLCHGSPPIVVLYPDFAYLGIHFFGGRSSSSFCPYE